MRSAVTPVNGKYYYANPEFWNYLAGFSGPRILVIQDGDEQPGVGALLGEAYARISRAFGCVACITNGAVRDLRGIEALGYQVFSGSVAVSHAYAHVVDFGEAVEMGGLRISNGDLFAWRLARRPFDSATRGGKFGYGSPEDVLREDPGNIRPDGAPGFLGGVAVLQAARGDVEHRL